MKKLRDLFLGNNDARLNMNYNGIIRFVPLLLAGGFFFVTILLHAFGPTDWNVSNPQKLYSFLLLCFVALVAGYSLAVCKGKSAERKMNLNIGRILMVGAVVFLILFFPLCHLTTGKWFPDVYLGITNTGAAYQITKYYSATGPKLFFYLRIILSPFIYVVMPITLFYYPKLSNVQKAFGISVIVLNIALGIAQGVNKHVADICMQLVLVLAILLFSGGKQTRKKQIAYCLKIIVLILTICLAFVLYYSNSMNNRIATDIHIHQNTQVTESTEIPESIEAPASVPTDEPKVEPTDDSKVEPTDDSKAEPTDESNHEGIISQQPTVNQETVNDVMNSYANFSVGTERKSAFWDTIIPDRFKPIVNYMISYFCHGYNGLSYAMEEDFTSSLGFGFSDFIRHNVARFFGGATFEEAMYQRTYMAKIEKYGWQTGLMWSSFFIFPASDISFPGTVLLVFLIGYLFGLSWKDTITTENPFACAAFFGFTTMVFYFSANNQMFQTGENCLAFCAVLFAWILSRSIHCKEVKK